jgi:hypothetical protein
MILVFYSYGTQDHVLLSLTPKSNLLHDWRLTANQIVLAQSSLRLTTGALFGGAGQLNPSIHMSCVTSSLTREWVFLSWTGFAFAKFTYRTCNMLLKILPCVLYTSPLSVQAWQSRSCLANLCYNSSLVTWTVVSLTTAKSKPLIFFYAWLRLLVRYEHVHSHDFVWLLLVACILLLYNRIRVYKNGWKPCANRGPVCT